MDPIDLGPRQPVTPLLGCELPPPTQQMGDPRATFGGFRMNQISLNRQAFGIGIGFDTQFLSAGYPAQRYLEVVVVFQQQLTDLPVVTVDRRHSYRKDRSAA